MAPKIDFEITEARFSPYLLDSIVSLLVFDSDFLKRGFSLFKPQVFDGERKTMAELCYEYFQKYSSAPGEYIVDILENYLSRRQSQRALLYKYLDKLAGMDVNKNYVLESFGSFIKDKMCADAINRASDLQRRGRSTEAYNEIISTFKEANLVTGQTIFDFLDPMNIDSVLSGSMSDTTNAKTFIEPYDKVTGGVSRDEMILLFGDTNIGKSYAMVHFGTVFALQGKNVLEIHLETSEDEIKTRHAKAFTGMQIRYTGISDGEKDSVRVNVRDRLLKKVEFVRKKGGHIWLRYPTKFTIANLRALLDDVEFQKGVPPDIVLLDSPKQMKTESKYKDYHIDEMLLYQDLFELKKERNITLICTAWSKDRGEHGTSGLTRGAQVGGTVAKIQIVDTVWSLTQNEQENKRGVLWFFVAKSRRSQKFMTYEIQQDLDRGQFMVSAKKIQGGSRAAEEARHLGLKYDDDKKEKEG